MAMPLLHVSTCASALHSPPQSDKVTGAIDFRGRRPGKDGMPVERVDKIFALLSLKMLIFLQFILAKQGRVSFVYLIKIFTKRWQGLPCGYACSPCVACLHVPLHCTLLHRVFCPSFQSLC